ncbi:MAG: phosphatidate cytidylyltransferase [Candidatus Omnitrophica bacterium]|nr:phosphatidate cytidylyltransferase [Candidatus Omnitrophota bacterium]
MADINNNDSGKAKLLKRVINSVLILTLTGLIIFCFPNWVYLLLAIFLIGLGLNEFFSIVEANGIVTYKYFGIIAGCLIPLAVYLHLGERYIDLEPLLIVIACLFAFILQFTRREKSRDHIISIGVTLLALFYISWFFSFVIKIKFLPSGNFLIAFLILVTKSGDVAAYFVGRAFGKHNLIPRISPKKTVEGTAGALFTSIAVALLASGLIGISLKHALALGVLLGIIGQVGDLAESLIKRDCGVKDSGGNLSGFGGVLDMIDSLLFTTPVFYFYIKMFL